MVYQTQQPSMMVSVFYWELRGQDQRPGHHFIVSGFGGQVQSYQHAATTTSTERKTPQCQRIDYRRSGNGAIVEVNVSYLEENKGYSQRIKGEHKAVHRPTNETDDADTC